jgi:hypothetical protein
MRRSTTESVSVAVAPRPARGEAYDLAAAGLRDEDEGRARGVTQLLIPSRPSRFERNSGEEVFGQTAAEGRVPHLDLHARNRPGVRR